jgi:hypothetical protein
MQYVTGKIILKFILRRRINYAANIELNDTAIFEDLTAVQTCYLLFSLYETKTDARHLCQYGEYKFR